VARDDELIKHSYLLAVAGTRFSAAEPARTLLVLAGIFLAGVVPWPQCLFQNTTIGAAMPKLEYVPITTPITMAKEKERRTSPPMRKRTSTVKNVSPLVRMV